MYKIRRIVAKIIDITIIVLTIMFVLRLLNYFSIGNDNPFVMIPSTIILIMLAFYLFFGVLGGLYFEGSIGKKMVGLVVVDQFDNVPSVNKMFMREPMVQYNIINIFIIITGILTVLVFTQFISTAFIILFSLFIFLAFIVELVYLIAFLISFDFWNNNYKILTTEEYDKIKLERAIEKSDYL